MESWREDGLNECITFQSRFHCSPRNSLFHHMEAVPEPPVSRDWIQGSHRWRTSQWCTSLFFMLRHDLHDFHAYITLCTALRSFGNPPKGALAHQAGGFSGAVRMRCRHSRAIGHLSNPRAHSSVCWFGHSTTIHTVDLETSRLPSSTRSTRTFRRRSSLEWMTWSRTSCYVSLPLPALASTWLHDTMHQIGTTKRGSPSPPNGHFRRFPRVRLPPTRTSCPSGPPQQSPGTLWRSAACPAPSTALRFPALVLAHTCRDAAQV